MRTAVTAPPCWKAHHGLCRSRENWCWKTLQLIKGKLTNHCLVEGVIGCFYRVDARPVGPNVDTKSSFVILAHKRGNHPKIALYLKSVMVDGMLMLKKPIMSLSSGTLALELLNECREAARPFIQHLEVSEIGFTAVQGCVDRVSECRVTQTHVLLTAESLPSAESVPNADSAGPVAATPRDKAFEHWATLMECGIESFARRPPATPKEAPSRTSKSLQPKLDRAFARLSAELAEESDRDEDTGEEKREKVLQEWFKDIRSRLVYIVYLSLYIYIY